MSTSVRGPVYDDDDDDDDDDDERAQYRIQVLPCLCTCESSVARCGFREDECKSTGSPEKCMYVLAQMHKGTTDDRDGRARRR